MIETCSCYWPAMYIPIDIIAISSPQRPLCPHQNVPRVSLLSIPLTAMCRIHQKPEQSVTRTYFLIPKTLRNFANISLERSKHYITYFHVWHSYSFISFWKSPRQRRRRASWFRRPCGEKSGVSATSSDKPSATCLNETLDTLVPWSLRMLPMRYQAI